MHNDLHYEVVTGGLHFLESNAQHFGHKFWYKLTLKSRENSSPVIGKGEQYGPNPNPNMSLEQLAINKGLPSDYYQGNSQFVIPTPDCEDLRQPFPDPSLVGTIPTSTNPPDVCGRIHYETTGGAPGPINELPDDYYLPDGRVASKYQVQGPQSFSAKGDNQAIQTTSEQVVDPQSNLNVYKDLPSGRPASYNQQGIPVYTDDNTPIPEGSEDYRNFVNYNKYGPSGRVLRHNREFWGDW
jgi:hypothetical protein